jgi:hypothetical protein
MAVESWVIDHPAHDDMAYRYRRLRDLVTDVFGTLADAGMVRAGVDVAEVARFTIALLDGLQIQWLHVGDEFGVADDLRSYFGQVLNARGRQGLERLLT